MDSIHFCKTDSIWSKAATIKSSANYFSLSERKRYVKLPNSRQTQFAISRLLLRSALSYQTTVPLSQWALQERLSNTPAILNQDWQGNISISHTKNFVACAVSEQAVGLDIEEPRVVPNLDKIAARVFTQEQQNTLHNNADDNRSRLFLQMWAEKEALFKAHSSAHLPIAFMSTQPLDNIGLATTNICTGRWYASLASLLPFDTFAVYFWRSPQQVRQIIIKPNIL